MPKGNGSNRRPTTPRPYSPREIAPRLASGECRVPSYNRLPPPVKEAIRLIARDERRSMSWVAERIYRDYLGLKVQYRPRKARKETAGRRKSPRSRH